MDIIVTPLNMPITGSKLEELIIEKGYNLAGQILYNHSSSVATLDNPEAEPKTEPVNVWVRNPGVIPAIRVADVLANSEDINEAAKTLFNMDVDELKSSMKGENEA